MLPKCPGVADCLNAWYKLGINIVLLFWGCGPLNLLYTKAFGRIFIEELSYNERSINAYGDWWIVAFRVVGLDILLSTVVLCSPLFFSKLLFLLIIFTFVWIGFDLIILSSISRLEFLLCKFWFSVFKILFWSLSYCCDF